VALELLIPDRQLEAEGGRLRVHAVGAPDHRGLGVLERAGLHGLGALTHAIEREYADRTAAVEARR
jgi:hypothetical protein